MTVRITERDDAHLSHEAQGLGLRIWDVYQQDLLVGMFHSEAEAEQYKQELEAGERARHEALETH